MNQILSLLSVLVISSAILIQAESPPKKIIDVELGRSCTPGAAPVGPGGSWQIVEHNVDKRCPEGSSCRKGACNCDNLSDGSVTAISLDQSGNRVCRRVAGQNCSTKSECFDTANCIEGKCVCDLSKNEFCVDFKREVTIQN